MEVEAVSKTPTAAARTISMFTGKTDIEAGDVARDGTQAERRERRRKPLPIKWIDLRGGQYVTWEVDNPRANTRIVEKLGKYYASVGTLCADFRTLIAATQWAEEELRKRGFR